jgi:predicted TIM-barrel fold metal-dependent hydrolase
MTKQPNGEIKMTVGKRKWIDTHIHVSNYSPDSTKRGDILADLLEVLDRSGADLRFVLSPDVPWVNRMMQDGSRILEANRFIYDLVRLAPNRLYGSCMITPNFLDDSLKAIQVCFQEWGFIQLGEMVQYLMKYRMDTDAAEKTVRLAMQFDVPIQVHLSTSGRTGDGPMGSGMEQLGDFFGIVERVPDAKYILAHAVGMETEPPVVDGYLDAIEKRYGKIPDNFWFEIRDFNSPGVRSVLGRVSVDRIIAGTDWTTRVGPPFQPYGVIVGKVEDNPYPPCIDAMVGFLRQEGASDQDIEKIGFGNAARLFKI